MPPIERFENLLKHAPMLVLGCDRDGGIVYINDSFCALLGYDREEVLGRLFWEMLTGPDTDRWRDSFLALRDEGVDNRFDVRIRSRRGEELFIAWHNVSFFDSEGRLETVYSIGADITALRRAEGRMLRLNATFKAMGEISRIALRTNDPRELLDRACGILVESGSCVAAWVALLDDDRQPVEIVGGPPPKGASVEDLQASTADFFRCITQVLAGSRQVSTGQISDVCDKCPFATDQPDMQGIATLVEHNGSVSAVLITHFLAERPAEEGMQRLFRSIADDLAFILAALDARAQHAIANRSLIERTRLLDAFFKNSLDHAAILDRDFNFLRANDAYAESCGFSADQLVGRNHFDLFPDENNERIFRQVRDTRQPYQAHARPFRYAHDVERGTTWWDWSLVPVEGPDGEIELLSFWLRDVTNEQRGILELEEQRAFVDGVIKNAGSLVVVFDADGIIMRFNAMAQEVTGWPDEEAIGRNVAELLIVEEEQDEVLADIQSHSFTEPVDYETRLQCRDGSQRRIAWRIAGISGDDGATNYIVCTGWDVTDERRMERELRESEEQYRELVETARIVIVRWDFDGIVHFMNDYALEFFGYTEDEIIGKSVNMLLPEIDSDGQDLRGLVANIADSTGDYWLNENENITKDGTRYWFSWSNRIIRDDAGKLVGVMGSGMDQTAEKHAMEQLESSREKLRDLTAQLTRTEQRERREIATVLHDNIGQSLAFAKMTLRKRLSSNGQYDRELSMVADYIDEVIAETRSITSQLSPRILSQLGLVAALHWLTEDMSKHHRLPITFKCETKPERVSEEVSLTLFNATRELITNIIKHAKARQVTVRLSLKDDSIYLAVADDGIGFGPAKRHPRNPGGGGFGLFNIEERVSYLGGEVRIESAPGRGTTVTLIWPIDVREKSTQ